MKIYFKTNKTYKFYHEVDLVVINNSSALLCDLESVFMNVHHGFGVRAAYLGVLW